ncbi:MULTISPECIES: hypothetical protein [Peribacillus]|nr:MULTISPECIES: hypothetical protein [unclassified Peribacillus]
MAMFWDNGVGSCYKEQETWFLYYAVDENDIEHDVKSFSKVQ